MLDEGSGAMEKKTNVRQPSTSGQCRNGSVSERKSDFVPNKRGRNRRPGSNLGSKVSDGQAPRPIPKWDRPVGDRRQRQRVSYDYRQREEVVESVDVFDVLTTGSRKGNANHLLNFKFHPRERQQDDHRWYHGSHYKSNGRTGPRKTKRYKKEQFLQACCQFVVRDSCEYTEQAINCDVLVDWSMIELVRSYSSEPVTCPICLQIPIAGKITKCGHTYCWACILHYLKLGQDEARKCPICYESVESEELKSVQCVDVPSFKIGDDIHMTLMRKAKGTVIALPKDQWVDRQGKHMNMQDGDSTKYMKLLVASMEQIKGEVIEKERQALVAQLLDAEESEICFIQMAIEQLKAREASLKYVFRQRLDPKDTVYIPGLGSIESIKPAEIPMSDSTSTGFAHTTYSDAFEDELLQECVEDDVPKEAVAENIDPLSSTTESDRQRDDSESSLPFGSPPCPFPLIPDQEVNAIPLTLEETSDHLELPIDVSDSAKPNSRNTLSLNTSDTYYFYQASTGQHIYLNSLNAQCLAKEYGSLENSPTSINATVVAIERIFMTEDIRKRLRYLDHIPMTSEIHVVELNIKPPTVSKDTLKHFEAAFNKKRKVRQQKDREDKRRANKQEMEHKKSFGIYPEVELPLNNLNQFPTPLVASSSQEDEFVPLASSHSQEVHARRTRNDSNTSDDSLAGSRSFAQMLKAPKTASEPLGAWGRAQPPAPNESFPSLSPAPRYGRRDDDDSDGGESLPAPSYTASMSDAIGKALDGIHLQKQTTDNSKAQSKSGGRKKRKEKQILFSTSMARTN